MPRENAGLVQDILAKERRIVEIMPEIAAMLEAAIAYAAELAREESLLPFQSA